MLTDRSRRDARFAFGAAKGSGRSSNSQAARRTASGNRRDLSERNPRAGTLARHDSRSSGLIRRRFGVLHGLCREYLGFPSYHFAGDH